jgi:hypothetical protein
MAGIPRPVDDLPNGSVSVRVIRGSFANNLPNQPVQLHAGADILTVNTDAEGRAQFDNLTPGAALRAVAIVDGERLESEPFSAPAQGGIRLVLLASGDPGAPSGAGSAAAVPGSVSIGGQSRIIIQPGDGTVTLYYLLEIVNPAPAPVNPTTPFTFDMPAGTTRTEIMQGSSVPATVSGSRVQANGPFPPGTTLLNVGSEIAQNSGTLEIAQMFPAAVDQFALIVQKMGDTAVSSPFLTQQREVAQQGEVYIAGAGAPVAAGQALSLTLTNLPHYSQVPRWTALAISFAILVAGAVAAVRAPDDTAARAAERKRLLTRREKLLIELARLERDRSRDSSASDSPHYVSRRKELVDALEQIYGALDSEDPPAESVRTAGATA